MTSSPIAGEREAFEAWFEHHFMAGLDGPGEWDQERNCYVTHQVHMAWKGWQARAALLEPVGEGWVMVPKEPTDEMLTRAVYAIACGTAREVALKHYRAMIAASPKSNGGMGS